MDGNFCLTFKGPRGLWFVPTVPEARKWRGPYMTERDLDDTIRQELGNDVTIHRTTVNGPEGTRPVG